MAAIIPVCRGIGDNNAVGASNRYSSGRQQHCGVTKKGQSGLRGRAGLVRCWLDPYDERIFSAIGTVWSRVVSIDKSLRRKNTLARARSVLTRAERIAILKEDGRFTDGRSPFGLPKVRVMKVVKAKKAKKEEAAATETAGEEKPAEAAATKKK
jgi:small basic protein (TIGR04137 family)